MTKKLFTTTDKVNDCLLHIDNQLEHNKQTYQVAETIIKDIKNLTESYQKAMKKSQLIEHADTVHMTQKKWVKQLQKIVNEKNSHTESTLIINALHKFANNLNESIINNIKLDLPTAQTQSHLEKKFTSISNLEKTLFINGYQQQDYTRH